MPQEDDPKSLARKARKMAGTEKVLRQFLSLESGNYGRPSYRKTWDRMHEQQIPLKTPLVCKLDGYKAETVQDLEWHEEQCGHDPEHDFAPYVPPPSVNKIVIHCQHCGGRHFDGPGAENHHTHTCEFCKQEFYDVRHGVGV